MALCTFSRRDMTCPTCGYVAARLPTYRECRPPPETIWRPYKVGDAVERVLVACGITKDRVERWTRTAGKPGGCGCDGRRRWLNEWGGRVQWEVRRRLLAARRFYLGD